MNFLEEIATLGAQQAAAALSTLLKSRVKVDMIRAVDVTLADVLAQGPRPAADVFVGVWFTLHGEHMGRAVLLFSRSDACRLVDAANRKPPGATLILDDYAQSTVREIANIVAGAFFAAVRKVVPVVLLHSVPRLAIDQWEQIVGSVLVAQGDDPAALSLIECELVVEAVNSRCLLVMVAGKWQG